MASHKAGNHRILLNGKGTLGPQLHYVILTLIFLILILSLTLQLLIETSLILTLIFLAIAISEIYLFLLTAFTEPGIVPPQPEHENNSAHPPVAAIVNGVTMESKWCFACNIYTPPRGKHCQQCQVCVERFDHHCKFLSNCIGARNYRNFFMLLFNTFLLGLFVLLFIISTAPGRSHLSIWWLLLISSGFSILVSANLVIYHGRLILNGSTSYEKVKGFAITENDDEDHDHDTNFLTHHPFSLGNWRMNLNAFLSKDIDPSKFASTAATSHLKPTVHGASSSASPDQV